MIRLLILSCVFSSSAGHDVSEGLFFFYFRRKKEKSTLSLQIIDIVGEIL